MILQACDVIDCLKVIAPEYEFKFLFDHSSGHPKKRDNGLDVRNMNVDWGGSSGMHMRPTKIQERKGYIGPYHEPDNPWMVPIGQNLCHVYPKDGEDYILPSPFNLSPTAREEKKNDIEVEIPIDKRRERAKFRKELIPELMETETGRQVGNNMLEKMLLPELNARQQRKAYQSR